MFDPSLLLSGTVNWLLTYAIHSTVLVCAVWAITLGARWLSHSTRDVLWKLALIGPLVTTSVQAAAGLEPLSWAIALDGQGGGARAPATPAAEPVAQRRHTIVTDSGSWTMVFEPDPAPAGSVAAPTREGTPKWPWVLVALWAGGAALCGAGLLRRAMRLRASLADRKEVVEDPVLETFLTLCQQAGISRKIRLSAAPGVTAPISWGRSEICIPERSLTGLDLGRMRAMLARELGRVERRDPHWSGLARVIEAVFFFQPLTRLARHELEQAADRSCEAWAADHCAPAGSLATRAGGERRAPDAGATQVALVVGLLTATTWLAPAVVQAPAAPRMAGPSARGPVPAAVPVDARAAASQCGHACGPSGRGLRIRAHSRGMEGGVDFDLDLDLDFDLDEGSEHPRHRHAHRLPREHLRWLQRLEEHEHLEELVDQMLRDALDE